MGQRRQELWQEILRSKIMAWIAIIYSAAGFFDLVKSEFLPEKYHAYTIVRIIPHFPLAWWIVGLLVFLLLAALEGGYIASLTMSDCVKSFLSVLHRALRRARHFALVEQVPCPPRPAP